MVPSAKKNCELCGKVGDNVRCKDCAQLGGKAVDVCACGKPKKSFSSGCWQCAEQQQSARDAKYGDSLQYLKGRIAETIIEELLLELGCTVCRNGLENAMPLAREKHLSGSVYFDIARRPDFIVLDNKDTYYVEVKYRADGQLDEKEIARYPSDTVIVLVSPKKLQGFKKKDYPNCVLLGDIAPFSKDRKLVKKYVDFCALIPK